MTQQVLPLLAAGTATGSWFRWNGGPCQWLVEATTWGGATATLQQKSPNGTAITLSTDLTATANKAYGAYLPAGEYRLSISGGPPTAMSSWLFGIPVNA